MFNKKVIKIIHTERAIFNGTTPVHNVIDELEQCRLQLGMSPKDFAEYFDSLKPNADVKLDMDRLLIYGTGGGIDTTTNHFEK